MRQQNSAHDKEQLLMKRNTLFQSFGSLCLKYDLLLGSCCLAAHEVAIFYAERSKRGCNTCPLTSAFGRVLHFVPSGNILDSFELHFINSWVLLPLLGLTARHDSKPELQCCGDVEKGQKISKALHLPWMAKPKKWEKKGFSGIIPQYFGSLFSLPLPHSAQNVSTRILHQILVQQQLVDSHSITHGGREEGAKYISFQIKTWVKSYELWRFVSIQQEQQLHLTCYVCNITANINMND